MKRNPTIWSGLAFLVMWLVLFYCIYVGLGR